MRHVLGRAPPQTAGHLLDPADHQPLILVLVGDDDAQDLQHRVGEVGVPAAGAEPDLAEHLAMAERPAGEGTAGGDEVVEAAVVPDGHECVPQLLEPCHVARADRVLQGREARPFLQRLAPGVCDFVEERRQLLGPLDVERVAVELDHRARARRDQRIGEWPGLQADPVEVVEEGGGGARKAHAAELGDHALRTLEGLRAQAAADPARLVDHGLEAQSHQLVGGDHAGRTGTDDRHLLAVALGRQGAEAARMRQPVVVGEREIRAEIGDRAPVGRCGDGRGVRGGHRRLPDSVSPP